MLIVRAYTVLDSVVVEATCHHPGDVQRNHLVLREERRDADGSALSVMKAAADVLQTAIYFALPESETGRPPLLCELNLEWASPSD